MEFQESLNIRLYKEYVKQRCAVEGQEKYVGSSELHDACGKTATICQELKADPVDYIHAQFRAVSSPNYIFPSQLHSAYAIKNYQSYMDVKFIYNPATEMSVQMGYLMAQLKQQRKVEEALIDDDVDFAPWFRIVITKEPNQDIITKYKDIAKATLKPELVEYLKTKKLDVNRILC